MVARVCWALYTPINMTRGGAATVSGKKTKEKVHAKVVVVEGAAPETGTKLTSERLSENLRSLNSRWIRKSNQEHAAGS